MTRRPARRRASVVLLAVLALVLAACTGVPTSSAPETIQPIEVGGTASGQQASPAPNIEPPALVRDFLEANTLDAGDHRSARRYLTAAARDRWSDRTATIVNATSVGIYTPGKPITVRGRVVGTLNTATGIYVPQLVDTGEQRAFNFSVEQVRGQWRISKLPTGLLLSVPQFKGTFREHSVYFFDNDHSALVPDSRWSALIGRQLNTWLMSQLVTGPRPELRNAVSTDVLPPQAGVRRVSASAPEPIKVDVPGALQLGKEAKRRLAAQVGMTLVGPDSGVLIALTDNGTEVSLPGAGSETEFTTSGLQPRYLGPVAPAPDVYYLGQKPLRLLRGSEGTAVKGKLDPRNYDYFFSSFAITASAKGEQLTVAAVTGTGSTSRLVIGDQAAGYRATKLQGPMSRPAWAPGRTEVWVGVGTKLFRAPVTGNVARPEQVSIPSAASGGRIVSVRLSPEGTRIAMVISSGSEQQLFVGSVVRSAGQVRVDQLQSITPSGVRIDDVAWLQSVRLIAIGSSKGGGAQVYGTNVDGALWSAQGTGVLPDPPDSVTAAASQYAWVSTRQTVWEQAGSDWAPAGPTSQTAGDKPVYLE